MQKVGFYPARQFAWIRIALGLYLALHFTCLLPFSPTVFGTEGVVGDQAINWSYGLLPFTNPLDYIAGSAAALYAVFACAIARAFLLAAGIFRRTAAVLLWLFWAALLIRNNYILNPSVPLVGWLLLVCALTPSGEPYRAFSRRDDDVWWMPAPLYWGTWVVVAASYSMSGILKVEAPSWQDGKALYYAVEQLLGRDWILTDLFLMIPPKVMKIMTWGVLLLEVLFLPLCITTFSRFIAWIGMTAMHIGLLLTMIIFDLTTPILIVHAFMFDVRWLAYFEPLRKKTLRATK